MKNLIIHLKKHKYAVMGAFLAFLVGVLVLVSCIFFGSGDGDNSDFSDSGNAAADLSSDGVLSGDSKLLFVCRGGNTEIINFMFLIDFKVYSETVVVSPLLSDTPTDSGTYSECFSYGGISLLKDAVQKARGCVIDRYVIMDEDGFKDIVDEMGKVTVNVTETFTYSAADKTGSVGKGNSELDSSMLFSYLLHMTNRGKTDEFTAVLCTVLNSYFASVNENQAQELFKTLTNYVVTDISIEDYYSAADDIIHLLSGGTSCVPYES